MLYQVSCSITFASRGSRDVVFIYLSEQADNAFLVPGDTLRVGKDPDGSFTLETTLRFAGEAERDEVYAVLLVAKEQAIQTKPSFIEQHCCGHDTGTPCTDSEKIAWGGGEDDE